MTAVWPGGLAASWLAPAWLVSVALSVLIAAQRRAAGGAAIGAHAMQLTLLVLALVSADGALAYGALAAAGGLLAWRVRAASLTAAVYIGGGALLALAAAAGHAASNETVVFVTSAAAIALRSGLFPLHAGIAALAEHERPWQLEQLAGLPVLVFAHLRFADHAEIAHAMAPAVVVIGGASMLLFALAALAARDLRRLYVNSTLMHGGMLCAAVGAAGRGHFGAAILVAITMVLALSGFHLMLASYEARVGHAGGATLGGRARAFPRLAAAIAFFGGAAVGLPGTAGFVADDLLLHALWEESIAAAVVAIVASALLAVATLGVLARAFFGPPQPTLAPDLLPGERRVGVLLIGFLLVLGIVPGALVSPVNALLQ